MITQGVTSNLIINLIVPAAVVAIFQLMVRRFCSGVGRMFQWAAKNGTLYPVIMLLLWVAFFPVMVIAAVFIDDRHDSKAAKSD